MTQLTINLLATVVGGFLLGHAMAARFWRSRGYSEGYRAAVHALQSADRSPERTGTTA